MQRLTFALGALAAFWAAPCVAQKGEGRLACVLSGTGLEGGVGAGVIDGKAWRLKIDTLGLTISFNKLEGRLFPTTTDRFDVAWTREVIRPTQLTVMRSDGRVWVNLVDKDTKRLLEFTCG
jgi:hypothetical protein